MFSDFSTKQMLRRTSQPLQCWERKGATFATEVSLALLDTEASALSFALQHTTSDQAAGDVMPLRPLRARLTAAQAELILTDTDHFLNLCADARHPTHLASR
jgi:hypothetical protein